ncbi:MAG: COQ9 family protein [Rhodobacteraceae bacterium]|nr:COQ9 family protein [Alphaproteobacteria bacterium]NNF71771.1 COQ9 family protein [Paracoccaceae bacterium]NNK65767.1 COQ9 family protein [Paracoccaceae bacterium]
MPNPTEDVKKQLLEAALPHVAFDGWSDKTFRMAVADSGIDPAVADTVCPRGAIDLAVAFHEAGDAQMLKLLKKVDLSQMRFRDKVTTAVQLRLDAISDKEAARRGATLFALPQHGAIGASLIWGTADAIWDALGDPSEDFNWYTKRATLSGVYAATVLYWLGDDSEGHAATREFLDRRIEDVMRIEKVKGQVRANPVMKTLLAGPNWALSKVRAPAKMPRVDIPGVFSGQSPDP